MAKKVKVRLAESDWEVLFKKTPHQIGSTTIHLQPLSLEELSEIMDAFKKIQADGKFGTVKEIKEGMAAVGEDNIGMIIFKNAPDILSMMSNLDVTDVRGLPPLAAVELFNACLDVNLASQEALLKNFGVLAEKVTGLTEKATQMQLSAS